MRTIHTVKASKRDYYEKDESLRQSDEVDYYTSDEQHSLTAARWWGKGAVRLGLTGSIRLEDFKRVMSGYHPRSDRPIPRKADRLRGFPQTGEERLAHDATFSAPKSVSMALHVGGDERLFWAHQEAVRETLELLEDRYAQARHRIDGTRVIEPTGNLIVGLINHHTSRELDCQLHTHCVIMNATQREDGRWVSLGHEDISKADWVGHYYRNVLAQKVQGLGYRIYQTRDAFEIEGISRQDIEQFSKRTTAATQRVLERQEELTPANLKRAAHATRKAKKINRTLEELQQEWRAEAQKAGITIPSPTDHPIIETTTKTPEQLIDSAIAHYSERLVSFRREDLYRYAFDKVHGHSLTDIDQAIDQHPELITHAKNEYTTVNALEREVKSLELMEAGKSQHNNLGVFNEPSKPLNPGQHITIENTLQSTDQIVVWHGKAGVGKTYALGELAIHTPIKFKGFAPTKKAAQELANSLGIETNTIQAHLLKQDSVDEPELWIVDEAGLLDAEKGLELLEKARDCEARVLLVGDTRQNQSIGAGSFLRSLIDHGAQTYNLSQILRQQNNIQRRAVELISEGRGVDALSLLDEHGYIHQSENSAAEIAEEFLSLSQPERNETLIVAGTNAERLAIAQSLRTGFHAEGKLGKDHEVKILKDLKFTAEQGRDIDNYQKGDYLRLQREYQSTRIKKGTLHQVLGKEGKFLILQSTGGQINYLEPSRYKEKSVYQSQDINLAVGDRVTWKRNTTGLSNGDELKVTQLSETSITLTGEKGTYTVPLNQPLDLDYGYVITSYRGQGQKAKRVLMSSTSDQTSCAEPFYVAISRQWQELKVWVKDKPFLYKLVKQSLAQDNPFNLVEQSYGHQHSSTSSRSSTIEGPTTGLDGQSQSNPNPDATDLRRVHHRVDNPTPRQEGEINPDGLTQTTHGRNQDEQPNLTGDVRSDSTTHQRRLSLQQLAAAIVESHIEEAIAQPIAELEQAIASQTQTLEACQQQIHSLTRKTKVKALSRAIEAWRELQGIEHSAQLIQLTERIQTRIESQTLEQSATLVQLSQGIQQLQEREVLTQAATLNHLTELIHQYKAEEAIAHALEKVQSLIPAHLELEQNVPMTQDKAAVEASHEDEQTEQSQPERMKPAPPILLNAPPPIEYDDCDRPEHLSQKHWEEFKQSAIHPDLIQINPISLKGRGSGVTSRLLEDYFEGLGSGQVRTKKMNRELYGLVEENFNDPTAGKTVIVYVPHPEYSYEQLEHIGGWWGSAGVDPLNNWEMARGGCFKGDKPRLSRQTNEEIKYEHPRDTESQFFLVNIPDWLAIEHLSRYGIEFDRSKSFWQQVHEHNLPVKLIEGYKKALSTIRHEIVIGIPGINALYRANEKVNGRKFKLTHRELTPAANVWATPGREIGFIGDQDPPDKFWTNINVRRDKSRGAELMQEATGVPCTNIYWDWKKGKGADDLIANHGPKEFIKALKRAVPVEREIRAHYRYLYNSYKKRGLNDVQIWLKACRENDIKDGDRTLKQSDYIRKHPEQAEDYIKQVKAAALKAIQQQKTQQSSRRRGR